MEITRGARKGRQSVSKPHGLLTRAKIDRRKDRGSKCPCCKKYYTHSKPRHERGYPLFFVSALQQPCVFSRHRPLFVLARGLAASLRPPAAQQKAAAARVASHSTLLSLSLFAAREMQQFASRKKARSTLFSLESRSEGRRRRRLEIEK